MFRKEEEEEGVRIVRALVRVNSAEWRKGRMRGKKLIEISGKKCETRIGKMGEERDVRRKIKAQR